MCSPWSLKQNKVATTNGIFFYIPKTIYQEENVPYPNLQGMERKALQKHGLRNSAESNLGTGDLVPMHVDTV